jgi:hypothetical protein
MTQIWCVFENDYEGSFFQAAFTERQPAIDHAVKNVKGDWTVELVALDNGPEPDSSGDVNGRGSEVYAEIEEPGTP